MDIGEDSAVMVAQGEVNLSSSGLVDEAELDGDMLLADGGSPERDRPLTDEQYVTEVVLDDENVVLGGDEIIMQAGEDSDQNITKSVYSFFCLNGASLKVKVFHYLILLNYWMEYLHVLATK